MRYLFFLFLVFYSPFCISQDVSGGSFHPTKNGLGDFKSDLDHGYRAFVLSTDKLSSEQVKILDDFITNNQEESLVFFLNNNEVDKFAKRLPEFLNLNKNISRHSEKKSDLILVSRDDFKNSFNQFNYSGDTLQGNIICRRFNFIKTDSIKTPGEADSLRINLTEKYGVVPDFVLSPYISNLQVLKDSLEAKPVYEAKVLLNGEDLKNVHWKEFPDLQTCGVFRTRDSTLTPQKRGFMFSPDIYNFTDRNTKISGPKTFRAYKYDLNEKLRYSLPFKNGIKNKAFPKDKSTQTDITFVKDEVKGKVTSFNGTSSFIDIRREEEGELEEISIAAWINPSEVDGSYSLLGKGQAFSAKIYFGRIQFTTPAIKDHTTYKRFIEPNTWSHIAIVFVPNKKLNFYLNGNLIEEVPASDIHQTDHALLVGTNLWGQYYKGLLSELHIWDRGLSDEEIQEIYDTGLSATENSSMWFWLSPVGLVLITGVFFLLKKHKIQTEKTKINEIPLPNKPTKFNNIRLLNGLKIRNKAGEDITHRFSPKRKELLILILLYTLKDGGITSKKMSDILWPGFSPKSKKNNRSTQIKEIRRILDEEMDATIAFENTKWSFKTNSEVFIDLFQLQQIIPGFLMGSQKGLPDNQKLINFARIVSKGPLLPQMEYEWLDQIKSEYNTSVLDLLTPAMDNLDNLCASEKMEIINAILIIDPLFESAVKKKVECLVKEGKHMSAQKAMENYKKLYESFYGESIDPKFLKLVK